MIKTTALAAILAISAPFAVQAETIEAEKYSDLKVSCEAANCGDLDVSFTEDEKVAQTRRTRTRRTRSTSTKRFLKDFYVGGSAGLLIDSEITGLGFQGSVFGGSMYNEFIGGDVEFTFGFAGTESDFVDDTITALGLYINPRFEYEFENNGITAFASPGIGLARFSGFGDSETELDFQIKAGAGKAINDKYDAFIQGRYQLEAEVLSVEGGVKFDISR